MIGKNVKSNILSDISPIFESTISDSVVTFDSMRNSLKNEIFGIISKSIRDTIIIIERSIFISERVGKNISVKNWFIIKSQER
jgi:hypothetical protein